MACSSLYVTRNNFASPLPVKLILRNDDYGSGYFGAKRSGGRIHKGIDLLADVGTPVLASKSGVVKYARHKKGNGNYVVLDHFWGYKTYYCHLLKITAKEGQRVNAGQVIGYVGKTGNANRAGIEPHLHFEVHKDNRPNDPALVILI
jgi:murein DD-endopeptidase MepM/ murein hydrolase activator NlpD